MKDVYLVNYSVKGIKTLDELTSLSFYKKIVSKELDTQEYNVKGIYGMNGSGKSSIVTSVDILKNILVNPGYLNNPIVQRKLDAIINKQMAELFIEVDYIAKYKNTLMSFRYGLKLSKDKTGKYMISHEQLAGKKATSKNDTLETIFEVVNGEVISIQGKDNEEFSNVMLQKTTNLLTTVSMCALFYEKILIPTQNEAEIYESTLGCSMISLWGFGKSLHVYLEQSDEHRGYIFQNSLSYSKELENDDLNMDSLVNHFLELDKEHLNVISIAGNGVPKNAYKYYEKNVQKLYEFLHIFKSDLRGIEIDKKENHDVYVCNLIMVYDSYRVHAEFESTGIKKLIHLFMYLREMVQGGIVFIDEFDSNLHDVYLCALLEYLMEHGKGQLCFTTHNVGPMDILRHHKKSIDFLSVDHKIYPWTKSGNYSPSKLYRNGMIEGSPFNVDSIDFIGVFSLGEEDE